MLLKDIFLIRSHELNEAIKKSWHKMDNTGDRRVFRSANSKAHFLKALKDINDQLYLKFKDSGIYYESGLNQEDCVFQQQQTQNEAYLQ